MSEDILPTTPQTSKKRVRKIKEWKQLKAKRLRNEGKSYVDRKGKTHKNKKLVEYNHQCRYKCNTYIPEGIRKEIFKKYWETGDWELQSAYLNGAITINPVSRKSTTAIKNNSVSCIYTIGEFRVCKEFFIKTLCVSNKRVQNIVNKKKMSISGISPRDNRGKKVPPNKIPEERVNLIKEHINKFPKYTSHYTREKNPNRKFLPIGLTIRAMYNLYKTFCNEIKYVEPEKESFYSFYKFLYLTQNLTLVFIDLIQIHVTSVIS